MLLTPTDVQNTLGILPTSSDLMKAHADIETFADVPVIDAVESDFKKSDLRKLKLAIAYQSVWLAGQVGSEQTTAVNEQIIDGQTIRTDHTIEFVLAPLAIRNLVSLSWKKGRKIKPSRPAYIDRDYAFTHEIGDDGEVWQPVPGWK